MIKPILFNTDMVQAIQDERKTVTRRILKLPKHIKKQENGLYSLFTEGTCYENQHLKKIVNYIKPPYQKGDILYVRETWAFVECISCAGDYRRPENDPPCYDTQAVEYNDGDSISYGCFIYRADCIAPERITWRPSIHMPKKAARIWLKVTDVRVERLRGISPAQLRMEGMHISHLPDEFKSIVNKCAASIEFHEKKKAFSKLWNSTVKKEIDEYGWDANPWVWVIEFERCKKPEVEIWQEEN